MKIPMTAVIDTSVMVTAMMSPTGASSAILDIFLEDRPFLWVISPYLYDEYLRKAAEKMLEIQRREKKRGGDIEAIGEFIDTVLHYIAKNAAWMEVDDVRPGVTADATDDPIGTLALESGVEYLVTLDGDFDPMKEAGYNLKIIRPGEFLRLLRLAT